MQLISRRNESHSRGSSFLDNFEWIGKRRRANKKQNTCTKCLSDVDSMVSNGDPGLIRSLFKKVDMYIVFTIKYKDHI